jgi:putative addiction module component (TIGR02574 family)
MTKAMIRKALLKLPVEDRLDLQEELTVSIARDENDLPLSVAHKRILRKRLAEYRENPSGAITHQEMKGRLKQLKRRLASNGRGNGE